MSSAKQLIVFSLGLVICPFLIGATNSDLGGIETAITGFVMWPMALIMFIIGIKRLATQKAVK